MPALGLANFIAGFGTGYFGAKRQQQQDSRQQALDQIAEEAAQRQQTTFDQQQQDRATLQAAATPIAAQPGTQVTDAQGNQDFAASPSDAAWLAQQAQDQASLAGPQAAPNAGQTAAAYGVSGGGQAPTISATSPDLAAANSPDATNARIVAALKTIDPVKGIALQDQIHQQKFQDWQQNFTKLQAEHQQAMRQAVGVITGGSPQQIGAALTGYYNDGNTYGVTQDPKSGAFTVSITGPKGNVLGTEQFADRLHLAGTAIAQMDPEKWMDFQQRDQAQQQSQANADRNFSLNQQRTAASVTASKAAAAKTQQDLVDDQAANQAAVDKANAAAALYQQQHPNATPTDLAAVRTGVLSVSNAAGKDAPPEVKLANALVNAGVAPDMKSALNMALQSKGQSQAAVRASIYKTALGANMGDAGAAQAATDKAMSYLYPPQPQPAPAAAPGAAPAPAGPAGQFQEGKVYINKATGQRGMWQGGQMVPLQ